MKPSFKPHIYFDKKEFKNMTVKIMELKLRVKFILSLLCDFSTEVSIKFCHTDEMQQTNTSFRKKNYATDVLSFPNILPGNQTNNAFYLGDILICIPVCLAQAKKAKVSIAFELEKMIVHGIVHLKGFDHERSPSAWRVMNSLEGMLHNELIAVLKKPTWCSIL